MSPVHVTCVNRGCDVSAGADKADTILLRSHLRKQANWIYCELDLSLNGRSSSLIGDIAAARSPNDIFANGKNLMSPRFPLGVDTRLTRSPARLSLFVVVVALVALTLNWESAALRVGHAQSGLVAAFNFDEGTGSTAADLSGLGNHGVVSGATWTTAGKVRKSAVVHRTGHLVRSRITRRSTSTSPLRSKPGCGRPRLQDRAPCLSRKCRANSVTRCMRAASRQGRRPGHALRSIAIGDRQRGAVRKSGRILPRPMTTRRSTSTSTASASPRARSPDRSSVRHATPHRRQHDSR